MIKQLKARSIAEGALGLVLLTSSLQGQTNLNFNKIAQTSEGSIQLSWNSTPGEVYEIDEADSLIDTNTGTITWNFLYDGYPSQGTNTIWLDTGNYNLTPQILNPIYTTTRFYRIVKQTSDSTSDEPVVSINGPTNSQIVANELTITVTAQTEQPVLAGTKLYVDGQEMPMADSITNYTDVSGVTNYETATYHINTCEWINGTHLIFASAECESGYGDDADTGAIASGHGVSPFVSVLFNNLVEGIAFSEPSFDPSSGQTQEVSAYFALDSDWTLNIVDVNTNIVFSTNGSGTLMAYNWDGNGNGGTNLPSGIYYYYISASTNGGTGGSGGGGGGGGSGPPSPDFESGRSLSAAAATPTELWAQPSDGSGIAVPLIIYPPGIETNDLTIFEAPIDWNALAIDSDSTKDSLTAQSAGEGGFSPDGVPGPGQPGYVTPLPNPQTTPPTPQRPPTNPVKGGAGTFAVAYDTYSANGTNPVYCAILSDGSGAGTHISMAGHSASTALPYAPLLQYKTEVNNLVSQMQHWGWKNSFVKVDDGFTISQLRGSGAIFNSNNVGVLYTHGVYGSSPDFTANQCKQMYFPITSGGSAQYLRLSEMNLGGVSTNGLKWMALNSCYSLYSANWTSMKNAGVKPYNSNLHLLLGENNVGYTSSTFGSYWAKYMNYGVTNYSPLTVRSAWYQAAKDAYHNIPFPSGTTISYAVAGDSACHDDTLQTNSTPTGSWFYDSQQVYP